MIVEDIKIRAIFESSTFTR